MDARSPTTRHASELTLRGLVLGAVVTIVFMAANVYMGLKTGMTFSSSIPAAMIAMGCLRLFGGHNILENNIVQTQASAAGTLCNVILVLPGLVQIGYWHDFPFWQTSAVCLLGGLIGVAYSIPLRRALVAGSGLPYPEGRAAAEVLQAGDRSDGLRTLLGATLASGAIGLATSGFKILAEGVHTTLSLGPALFRLGSGFSLALVGVGYLVGIGACLAVLTGAVIAWGVAVPILTAMGAAQAGAPDAVAEAVWSGQVRLIGAGIIAVGGVWTIASLASHILASIRDAFVAARASRRQGSLRDLPREERDIPITWVAGMAAGLTLPMAGLFAWFAHGAGLQSDGVGGFHPLLALAATLFVVLFGFLMAAACGYLAGLLGSSSSPISGIGILTTMAAALLLPLLVGEAAGPEGRRFVVAMALLVASVIVTIASIANDNLQDLKTGQLVGATPWRQQVALMVGVTVGAVVIAPLLGLLYQAYGFVGVLPRAGMETGNALPAPQASLMAQIARGIVGGELPWTMVLIGVGLGVPLVGLEARLRRRGVTFPALTVGIGMYLPLSVEVTIAVGGILGWLSERSIRARARSRSGSEDPALQDSRRRGVLLAAGFLVGESFLGVVLAAADTLLGRGSSLALAGPGFAPTGVWLGSGVFAIGLVVYYRLICRTV